MDPKRTAKISRLAENLFEKLCFDAGLTPSQPKHDENGWDFIVEFPQNRIPRVYLDAQPAAIKFLCQVKSTDTFANKVEMKVSNWDKLARTPIPAFMFVLDFDGRDEPKRAYLCHFGVDRVAQTLKKVRELEKAGIIELNQSRMDFCIDKIEEIPIDRGEALSQKVLNYTGNDFSSYAREKSQWLETLGFERGTYQLSIPGHVNVHDLVNAYLGISDLKADKVVVSTNRFGINMKFMEHESVSISFSNNMPLKGRLIASSKKAGRRLSVEIGATVPPLPGLPREFRKIRLRNSFLDIFIAESGSSPEFNVEIDCDIAHDFGKLHDNIEFICLCSNKDVRVDIFVGQERLGVLNCVTVTADTFIESIKSRLRLLRKFITFLGYRQNIQVRVLDIIEHDLRFMHLVVEGKGSISFDLIDMPVCKIPKTGVFTAIVPLKTVDKYIVGFCYWRASVSAAGNRFQLKLSKSSVWTSREFDSSDTTEFGMCCDEFNKYSSSLNKFVFSWGPSLAKEDTV